MLLKSKSSAKCQWPLALPLNHAVTIRVDVLFWFVILSVLSILTLIHYIWCLSSYYNFCYFFRKLLLNNNIKHTYIIFHFLLCYGSMLIAVAYTRHCGEMTSVRSAMLSGYLPYLQAAAVSNNVQWRWPLLTSDACKYGWLHWQLNSHCSQQ